MKPLTDEESPLLFNGFRSDHDLDQVHYGGRFLTRTALESTDETAASLPRIFSRYGPRVNNSLKSALHGKESSVYTTLRYSMGWTDSKGKAIVASTGKALRPILCLFACETVGGSANTAMPAAVALEFIHNFSLIHDDIQDKDEMRRGRPSLWVVWSEPKAIIAGNVLRVVADMCLEQLVRNNVTVDHALAASQILTEAYLQMIEGQYLDILFERRLDIGLDDYLEMIGRKTGALIRCALEMGATLGNSNSNVQSAFREFGRCLGFVFQIRDDVLGVWGKPDKTGKPVGADIKRKKNSFPIVHAMNYAKGADARLLKQTYGKESLDENDVSRILEVMDRLGTQEYAQSLAKAHCEKALDAIQGVELSPQARIEIEDLAKFLLTRDH